jgi:uncharacterized membrane protein required for colicin V production
VRDLSAVDWTCLGLLGLACLRGLAIGLIREAFSLAALAAAVISARVLGEPAAQWLLARTEQLGPAGARLLGGAGVALAALLAVAGVGRMLRRGARVLGLGLSDRLAGGALGLGEGALAAGLLLLALVTVLGADHPTLAGSRSLGVFAQVERIAGVGGGAPDVAAPPPRR